MKLFKLIVTLVVLALIALFVWQNMETWMKPASFKLNLYLGQTEWSLELYVIMFLSAFVGFILGALALMKPYVKTRRLLVRERQEKKEANATPAIKESPAEAS